MQNSLVFLLMFNIEEKKSLSCSFSSVDAVYVMRVFTSRKHAYIILTPLNPTLI